MSSSGNAQREKRPIPAPELGDTIAGKYRIEALLGTGGMGAVYRAQHRITGRRVALKWLHSDSEAMRKRFFREARAMAAMEHPNVVSVLDMGEHDGAAFLVMEFLEGSSLREYANRKAMPYTRAIKLLMPALEGVAAAHLAGLVHRDLKPDNIFICQDVDGTPYDTKVLDFGIARPIQASNELTEDLTREGSIIGTPRYMAPEQILAEDVDQRADVFALGIILWELLVGQLPYKARNYEQLVVEVTSSKMPSPRAFVPEVPEGLAQVVLRALAKGPEDRYPDVAAFARELAQYAEGVSYRPPRSAQIRRARFTLSQGAMSPPPEAANFLANDDMSHERPSAATVDIRKDKVDPKATMPARPGANTTITGERKSDRPTAAPPAKKAPAAKKGRVLPETRRAIDEELSETLDAPTTGSNAFARPMRAVPTDSVRLPTRRSWSVGAALIIGLFVFAAIGIAGWVYQRQAAEAANTPPEPEVQTPMPEVAPPEPPSEPVNPVDAHPEGVAPPDVTSTAAPSMTDVRPNATVDEPAATEMRSRRRRSRRVTHTPDPPPSRMRGLSVSEF